MTDQEIDPETLKVMEELRKAMESAQVVIDRWKMHTHDWREPSVWPSTSVSQSCLCGASRHMDSMGIRIYD